jgi:hypothetical protein
MPIKQERGEFEKNDLKLNIKIIVIYAMLVLLFILLVVLS